MLLAQFAEQFINHSRHQSSKLATCLLPIDHGTPTRVLELGCGTGVVGVAMAIMHANTRVILSDLVDARDGVQRLLARVGDRLNRSSECTFEVLDWMIPLETRWTEDSLDLLVVSDCTYNADTVPALVRTLRGLARLNPRAKLLLAHKIRHIDELGFYHQLGNAGWKSVEHTKFCMGSVKPAADGQTDTTSLHVYLFEWLHG